MVPDRFAGVGMQRISGVLDAAAAVSRSAVASVESIRCPLPVSWAVPAAVTAEESASASGVWRAGISAGAASITASVRLIFAVMPRRSVMAQPSTRIKQAAMAA